VIAFTAFTFAPQAMLRIVREVPGGRASLAKAYGSGRERAQ
jgi:hypothetical protein